jgi:hypothetical protein
MRQTTPISVAAGGVFPVTSEAKTGKGTYHNQYLKSKDKVEHDSAVKNGFSFIHLKNSLAGERVNLHHEKY